LYHSNGRLKTKSEYINEATNKKELDLRDEYYSTKVEPALKDLGLDSKYEHENYFIRDIKRAYKEAYGTSGPKKANLVQLNTDKNKSYLESYAN
jgi:hypothetical protein